jgi:hypothetical protein
MSAGEWVALLVVMTLVLWPSAPILGRAAFAPALGVLMLVPGLNIARHYYFAFAKRASA